MTTSDAKAYLAKREIPQLFESLMTGLMYYRPDDHITYLQECLRKVQDQGVDSVRWNLFIDQRRKTPLPPIGSNGHTPTPGGLERDSSFMTASHNILDTVIDRSLSNECSTPPPAESRQQDRRDLDDRSVPLPPIGGTDDRSYGQIPRGTRVQDQPTSSGSYPAQASQNRVSDSERRTADMPTCPIVLVMGGPGSGRATQCTRLIDRYSGWVHLSIGDLLRDQIFKSGSADVKWDAIGTLINRGEMAPEDVTMDLLRSSLQKHMSAKGIILEGFPRTLEQVAELENVVGNVDLAFVLDCEESYLQQRLLQRGQKTERVDDNMKAIANRMTFFKEKTLPVIKHFDDVGKVVIIDGDRDTDEIFYDLSLLFDHTFYSGYGMEGASQSNGGTTSPTPRPPSGPKPRSPRPGSTRYSRPSSRTARPGSGFANVTRILELDSADTGRKDELPDCHLMVVLGGPGVNRLSVANKMAQIHGGTVVISAGQLLLNNIGSSVSNGIMASDDDALKLIVNAIKDNKDAKGIILEGFPRNKAQVEALNTHVGGISAVILLDSEHYFMEKQLANKGVDTKDIEKRISYYKYNTLPIVAHYDDLRKLVVVNAEQNESDLFKELQTELQIVMHSDGSDNGPPGGDVMPPTGDQPPVPARLEISVEDKGRKPGGPQCCVIAIVGSPGSGVDVQCRKIVEKFSGFLHAKDVSSAQNDTDAKGIILEDYPACKADIEEFNEKLGGIDQVIVLDCEEDFARQNAGSRISELDSYKNNALPALAHFEDQNKLEYVNVQRNPDDVLNDLCKVIELAMEKHNAGPVPTAGGADSMPSVTRLDVKNADLGRKEGLIGVPVVSVIGNTGSHCSKLAESMPGVKHIQCTSVSDVEEAMKESSDVKGFLLENFPLNQDQFEEFNTKVGGMTGVIMMDASKSFLVGKGIDMAKLREMQQNTFPIIAYYEDLGKLEYVDSEQDDNTTFEALSRSLSLLLSSMVSS